MSPSNPAMKTSESLNVTIAVSDIPKTVQTTPDDNEFSKKYFAESINGWTPAIRNHTLKNLGLFF